MMNKDRGIKQDLDWDDKEVFSLRVQELSVLSGPLAGHLLRLFGDAIEAGGFEVAVDSYTGKTIAYRKLSMDEIHEAALTDNQYNRYSGKY
jgi:hypothetical protein